MTCEIMFPTSGAPHSAHDRRSSVLRYPSIARDPRLHAPAKMPQQHRGFRGGIQDSEIDIGLKIDASARGRSVAAA
jgi:hypothetical protein